MWMHSFVDPGGSQGQVWTYPWSSALGFAVKWFFFANEPSAWPDACKGDVVSTFCLIASPQANMVATAHFAKLES